MKYTVILKQPVDDARRGELQELLTTRFGLSAEQAGRLAARRTGRLMKPTSRARAELLLEVYQSVGADVALDALRDETSLTGEPFVGVAPSAWAPAPATPSTPGDDTLLAPERATPAADPFAAAFGADAWPGDASADSGAWRAQAAPTAPTAPTAEAHSPQAAVLTMEREAPAAAPEGDVWTDFTGALSLEGDAPRAEQAEGAEVMPMLVSPETAAPATRPRRPLARQLALGTVLPLALVTVVTVLLLSALLPRLQGQLVRDQAQTLAATLGTTLNTGSESLAYSQLDTVLKDPNVAFVRIEKPGGNSYIRTKSAEQSDQWNASVAQWTGANPGGGQLRLGGQTYIVTRLSVVEGERAQPVALPVSAERGPLIHRVTVGLSNARFTAFLRNTILLVLAASLASLLVALYLAGRAARAVVEPIETLVKAADAISMGDLSRPVQADRNDEIGDLAQALERMRLSLEAAMDRLRRRKQRA